MEPDELIAKALATYSAVEPAPHFTERVVARTRVERRWGGAGILVLVAAASVFAIVTFERQPPPVIAVRVAALQPPNLRAYPEPRFADPQVPISRVRRRHKPADAISEQERTLLLWVAERPGTEAAEWAAMKFRSDAPLAIEAIGIEPIAIKEMNQ